MGRVFADPVASQNIIGDLTTRARSLADRTQALLSVAMWPVPGVNITTVGWGYQVTNADYVYNNWYAQFPRVQRTALRIEQPWSTGAGSTGEMKMEFANLYGFGETEPISCPANSTGLAVWTWTHGVTLWTPQSWLLFFARRPSGTNFFVWTPYAYLIDPAGCTASGLAPEM